MPLVFLAVILPSDLPQHMCARVSHAVSISELSTPRAYMRGNDIASYTTGSARERLTRFNWRAILFGDHVPHTLTPPIIFVTPPARPNVSRAQFKNLVCE